MDGIWSRRLMTAKQSHFLGKCNRIKPEQHAFNLNFKHYNGVLTVTEYNVETAYSWLW